MAHNVPIRSRNGLLAGSRRTLRVATFLGQALVLAAVPGGGQNVARRNAWSARTAEAARCTARREAAVALGQAQARAVTGPRLRTVPRRAAP